MTDRHGPVVSTQEAPPSSASAGPAGFVPSRPQLFPSDSFIYRPRFVVPIGCPTHDVAALVMAWRLDQLERRQGWRVRQ